MSLAPEPEGRNGLALALPSREVDVREVDFHWARRMRTICLTAVMSGLISMAACHGGPVVDLSTKPVEADGTISGAVRGPEGTSPISGRAVEVVNVDTGERQHGTTSVTGGFTLDRKSVV